MKRIIISFLALVLFLPSLGFAQNFDQAGFEIWKAKRLKSLLSETGWLNLAGLYWLKDGNNTIGGADGNDCQFPTEHSEGKLGNIYLEKGKVYLKDVPANATITVKGVPFSGGLIFEEEKESPVLVHQSLRWFIIKRGEKYAIRLRDLESEFVKNFKGIEYFPFQSNLVLKAKFVPTKGRKLKIVDVTGRVYEEESPGKVVFNVAGKEYALLATQEGDQLFIVFGDTSNKHETYGGGRFLYVDMPKNGEEVIMDFNRSYNPPCTFTPYATCPLPIAENKLPIQILAGEKYTSHY